jgi:hypothetical protein
VAAKTSATRDFILSSNGYFTESASVVALAGACPTPRLAMLWRDDIVVLRVNAKRKWPTLRFITIELAITYDNKS